MTLEKALSLARENAVLIDRDNIIPPDILGAFRDAGFYGPYKSVDDARSRIDLGRILSRDSVGAASTVLINASVQFLVSHIIEASPSEPMVRDLLRNGIAAVSLTEEGGGSDLTRNITVEAKSIDGGSYCLEGEKLFTSNGLYADYFLVLARENGELKLFLTADKDNIKAEPLDLAVFRGAGISRVSYSCAKAVELKTPKPVKAVLHAINLGRLGYTAIGVGIAEGAIGDALYYAGQRRAFGRSILEFQGIQWMIADAYSRLETVKSLYRELLSSLPEIDPIRVAIAKNEAARIAQEAAWIDVEIHGGRGLEKHSKPERLYRDARALDIGEGTREILRNLIASSLAKNHSLVTR